RVRLIHWNYRKARPRRKPRNPAAFSPLLRRCHSHDSKGHRPRQTAYAPGPRTFTMTARLLKAAGFGIAIAGLLMCPVGFLAWFGNALTMEARGESLWLRRTPFSLC